MPTKILVADDSVTMRQVLEMTFAGEDATVVCVDSGEAAINKLADFGPDIVFVDGALAGMDGYEATRRIKAQHGKVAVIVMASQHHPYDDGKGRAAGVDDHISKPFDTQSVIDRVGQVLARPRTAPASAGGEPARPAPPAAPVARPPVPAPVAAATPAASAQRMAQGTRLGIGAPVPVAAHAAAKPVPAPQPSPAAPLRSNATVPLAPMAPKPAPAAPPPPAVAVARPPAPTPAPTPAAPAVAAVSAQASTELAGKLGALGLSREQVEGVLALSREVIEQVVWEVVPELAEQLIKEELKRLTAD